MSRPCCGLVPDRIVACGRSCRGRVVGLAGRVSSMAAHHVAACRVAAPAPCFEPPYAVSWHAAVLYSSTVPSYRDPKSPPQPRYKYLYRDPAPLSPHCAPCCTRARPDRKPPGRIVAYYAVSWRAPALPCLLPPSLACHNTVCCIVTQIKKKIRQ